MIYDIQTLKAKYKEFANINQKISIEAKNDRFVRIKRGLYSDNILIDKPVLANICYEPSYLSFEYALSFYGLIPEYVSVLTSACFNKKNNKRYVTKDAIFEYKSIPNEVFSYGISFERTEDGIRYKIASKEKALCDILYSKYPVRSIKDVKMMLFDDLRIDEDMFMELDFDFIKEIAPLYKSNTLLALMKFINEVESNDNN